MKNREIIQQLFVVKNILSKAGNKEIFFENGLSLANYEIMKVIEIKKAKTISEIQDFLPETLSSLTQKTKKLEECGCLIKEKSKKDPRKKILKITSKGKKIITRIEIKIEAISSVIFLKYTKKEKEIFMKILLELEKQIGSRVN